MSHMANTGNETRTRMINDRWILSPLRLPIPPCQLGVQNAHLYK